jgi:hypothetical protein
MNSSVGKTVHADDQYLHVELQDGRMISTPIDWYPPLCEASLAALKRYQFICDGTGIEWEDLDYHLSIESMLTADTKKHAIA